MRKNTCTKCGKQIEKNNNRWLCVNLICIDYNKTVRRNRASKQKGQEKKILIQEEE